MTSQNSRKMSQELKREKRVSLIIADVGTIEEIFLKKDHNDEKALGVPYKIFTKSCLKIGKLRQMNTT
jgi:hypothetical protein